MRVLFTAPLIRNGHFVWCPVRRRIAHAHECQRCRFHLYAFACTLSILVAVAEFLGSHSTGSVSLWSDAWHVLSDGLGYCIGGVYAFLVSRRLLSKDRQEQVRHVAEFFLGALLVLAASSILADVFGRLWFSRVPVIHEAGLLLGVALVGLIVNGFLLWLFRIFGAGHKHGPTGHHQEEYHRRDKILQANFWHTIGDTASSVLVVLSAVIISFSNHPAWGYFDLAVSVGIAGFLGYQGIALLADED